MIDFGFSIITPNYKKLTIFCGTPSYMAPEIIARNYNGYSADIWALGIVLYIMLCGTFPFKGKKNNLNKFIIYKIQAQVILNYLKK